ncbi:MAG: N-acetyltransferase [Oscillospiraceae bacterium]|nr:N-acetyltransferase [Oscillospiraceae bacterium]
MTEILYRNYPLIDGIHFSLRYTASEDCADLLKVYSDEKAVPLFNSDNCNGDDFHYTTMECMKQALDFWRFSHDNRYFVRWTITDKTINEAIGTVELCGEKERGIFRLDLRSDYEKKDVISDLLGLCDVLFDYFDIVVTKAVPQAAERIAALEESGFKPYSEKIVGHDGTEYGDYYVSDN